MERIDKLMAHEGFGSRKDIRKLLRSSEVLLNGKRIYDPGTQIDIDKDVILLDGEEIDFHGNIYLMMNKIMHTVSSNKDGEHQTVFDLLEDNMRTPYLQEKLHLVGRLDMDTEGMLLFTTDGELTHRLISPKSHISKTYFCVLEHSETPEHQAEIKKIFAEGIEVGPEDNEEGFKCESADVHFASEYEIENALKISSFAQERSEYSATPENCAVLKIYEGKYHQVKRMFTAVGNKVIFLKRISMGSLVLDNTLEPGEYKYLDEADLEKLKS
ncbi:MAG: rRNA pseudouridine synthase [Treponema sp.]|nr:rRNA pseudouridine synthase [Treponema sp.]